MPTLNHSYTSPAKLNLMLKVVGKRDDGYHLLETVFCLIDLCDSIELLNRTDGKLYCTIRNTVFCLNTI
ncbi:MAG: hypothetical protein IJ881_01795 [Neisseriaceae bacterium]|nr:hypothetical protein [Neisseriaceae bacterium]